MKKKIHKIWLYILIPIFSLVVIILAAMNSPRLIFNNYFFEKGASFAKKVGIDIEWKKLDIKTKSKGFLDKQIRISFEDICIHMEPDLEKACFKSIQIGFRYKFKSLIPALVEIGPINIEDGEVVYRVAKSKDHGKAEKQKITHDALEIPDIALPDFIKKSRFFPFNIALKQVEITLPDGKISGDVNLTTNPGNKQRLTNIHIDARMNKIPEPLSLKVVMDIESESGLLETDAHIKGNLNLSGSSVGNASADIDVKQNPDKRIEYKTALKYNQKSLGAQASLSGHIKSDSMLAELNLNIRNSSSFMNRIDINNCSLNLEKADIGNNGKLEFNCPASIFIRKIDLPDEVEQIYQPSEVIKLTLGSKLDTFFMPDMYHPIKGNVNLKITSTTSKLVKTSGSVDISVDGTMEDLPKSMNLSADMNLDFGIADFSRLVKILNNTPFSVPAPLHALEGEIEFSLEGKIPSLYDISYFPVVFNTRLSGPGEKIYLDAKGEARFRLRGNYLDDTDVDMDLILTKIELPLPSLQIAALPQLAPDSRIKDKPSDKKKEKIPINYNLNISTPPEDPIEISSNLTKQPIPINLDLRGDENGFLGTIDISNFTLKLFRREAHIKEIKLELKNPVEYSTVTATIAINVSEYQIIVRMDGPVEHPWIWLESNPPLSEEDIISVLLYGEPFDDLDSDTSSSVGSMRSAMSNKAMAFTTFFLFAATPIQSVVYDPTTKQVTARFRLGKKTTLSVGGSGESRKGVGIRRRLGKGWLINTSVDQDLDLGVTSVTTFMEWHKRY